MILILTRPPAATNLNAETALSVGLANCQHRNCRSETKSALTLSPLRSPILRAGTITAFLVHLAAMYSPIGQAFLQSEPVALKIWGILLMLDLIIFPVMELHKWTWSTRHREPSYV